MLSLPLVVPFTGRREPSGEAAEKDPTAATSTYGEDEQENNNTDAYRRVESASVPRQGHRKEPRSGRSFKPFAALVRGLVATKHFIFAEDKTLQDDYIPNYRYWPILSGLIVPFAILLEIPGLTSHWYVRTDGYTTVEYRENPIILDAGMGISMGVAVIANICLIIRFLERRIYGMTVAAIVCLLIHDIINIIVVTIFGVVHRYDDGFTYSEAFWMTVCSTIASVATTITLLLDYFRTPSFSKSGSGLTRKQRSLVIIFMVLLVDIAVGALVYCYLLDLKYLDSLYFSVVSSFTIGFGDISPSTPGAKVFAVFYNAIGILNTGLFIVITRSTIVESFEQSYRRRRHLMRARKRLHRQLEETARTKRALHVGTLQFAAIAGAGIGIVGLKGQSDPSHDGKSDTEREEVAYLKFREDMAKEEIKEFRAKLWVSCGLFTAFWLIGSAIFMATEGWSYGTAVYFCFMAFSTIGYGDVSPLSGAGRAVFVFWAIAAVAAMTVFISVIAEAYQSRYSTMMHNGLIDRALKEVPSLSRKDTDATNEVAAQRNHRHITRDPDELTIDERTEARECIRQELAEIPALIIQGARDFHVQIRYVSNPNQGHCGKLPPGLQRVLDETMDQENMSEPMRKQALQDDAAKKALILLSLENTVKQLVEKAERMNVLLEEQDALYRERRIDEADNFEEDLAEARAEMEEDRRIEDEEMGNGRFTDPRPSTQLHVSRSPSRSSRRSTDHGLG